MKAHAESESLLLALESGHSANYGSAQYRTPPSAPRCEVLDLRGWKPGWAVVVSNQQPAPLFVVVFLSS